MAAANLTPPLIVVEAAIAVEGLQRSHGLAVVEAGVSLRTGSFDLSRASDAAGARLAGGMDAVVGYGSMIF